MAPYKSPPFGSCAIYFHHSAFVVQLQDDLKSSLSPDGMVKTEDRDKSRDFTQASVAVF